MISRPNEQTKLAILIDDSGMSRDEFLAEAVGESVVSAICMNTDCDYIAGMEPDQTEGYCEECHQNTMVGALVLAGLI